MNADAMSRQCSMINGEDDLNEVEVKGIKAVTTALAVDEVDIRASEILAKSQRKDLHLKEFYKLKEEFGNEKPELERIMGKEETLWNQWDQIFLQDVKM